MIIDSISRRMFLVGVGGGLVSLPFLSSLANAKSRLQQNRFICLFNGHGQPQTEWHPQIDLWQQNSQYLKASDKDYRSLRLHDLNGSISTILGPEISRFKDDISIIAGLDSLANNHNHNPYTTLSGGHKTASVDMILTDSTIFNPNRKQSLNLVASNMGYKDKYISHRWTNQGLTPVPATLNPKHAFDSFFSAKATGDLQKKRQSVASYVLGDYRSLLRNTRLSQQDRLTLEQHMEHLESLQNKLSRLELDQCSVSRPTIEPKGQDSSLDDDILMIHMDLLVQAIRCNMLATATLEMSTETDISVYNFLGINRDFHTISHSNPFYGIEMATIGQWMSKKVAYLIEQLNEIEDQESGDTFLDNTLIYWGNNMGCMHINGSNHQANDLPILIAGRGGHRFRTGYYLSYADFRRNQGRPYNDFLITLLDGFGIPPEAYEEQQNSGFGSYDRSRRIDVEARPVEGNFYDLGSKRRILSGLLS